VRFPRARADWRGSGLATVAVALVAVLASTVALARDVIPAPAFKPGMTWTYQQREDITGRAVGAVRVDIIAVATDRVTANFTTEGGPTVSERWDAAGNWEQVGTRGWPWLARLGGKSKRVEFVPALALYRFPLQPGASWVETVRAVDPDSGRKTEVKLFAKALKWEEVNVPAGKFMALKVRRIFTPEDFDELRSRTTVTLLDWYSPQVVASVRSIWDWEHQDYRRPPGDQLAKGVRTLWELTAYTSAK